MNHSNNSKEVIYSPHKIKSYFNGVKKIYPKRKSDEYTGDKLCLYKSNCNSETADTNTKLISKEKKICIKFKDLVAEDKDNSDNDDENFELALLVKKRRYTKKTEKNI